MTDNKQSIICPACGKPMKKIFISSANCNIDVCLDGCGGIFFDNMEYKKMDENHEDIHELLEATEGKTFSNVNTKLTRVCPICGQDMVKNFASAKHEVEIDECYGCGAVFLDAGELIAIRNQFSTEAERIADFNKNFFEKYSEDFRIIDERLAENKKHHRSSAILAVCEKLFGNH